MTGRLFALLAAFAALSLSALAAAGLLSSLYASATHDVSRLGAGRIDGVPAGGTAVALAPWRSAPRMFLAEALSARGELTSAIAVAEQAVALHPADGYAWAYLARLVTARMQHQPRALALYTMAMRRTPHSPALLRAIALDGVLRWRFADPGLQGLWRQSMRQILSLQRRSFLQQVARLGQDRAWCAAQAGELPIGRWCRQMQRTRANCLAPDLRPAALAWCEEHGLATTPR